MHSYYHYHLHSYRYFSHSRYLDYTQLLLRKIILAFSHRDYYYDDAVVRCMMMMMMKKIIHYFPMIFSLNEFHLDDHIANGCGHFLVLIKQVYWGEPACFDYLIFKWLLLVVVLRPVILCRNQHQIQAWGIIESC